MCFRCLDFPRSGSLDTWNMLLCMFQHVDVLMLILKSQQFWNISQMSAMYCYIHTCMDTYIHTYRYMYIYMHMNMHMGLCQIGSLAAGGSDKIPFGGIRQRRNPCWPCCPILAYAAGPCWFMLAHGGSCWPMLTHAGPCCPLCFVH